ncbi:MAG: 3-phosphoglycerate dehydrogenase family protein [Oscillospiraceae bacterium]|nr:3-phosphoglycerate dehydrogenase family protein [Oscillospiraceae bacterium]
MFNILTLNKIAKVGLDRLPSDKFTCADNHADPDGVILRSADMHGFELGGNLKAIARAGAGTNNIPVDACAEAGIVVFNTPGANANAVKELCLGALVLASRDVYGGMAWVQSLQGTEEVAKAVEKGKSNYVGPELKGKKIGVLGLGAIGAPVANAAYALDMEVYGYDPFMSAESAWKLSRAVKPAPSLNFLFSECDHVSLHIPSTPDNKAQLKEALAAAKPGLRIINMARGDLFSNDDILSALSDGRLARYVTDFPNEGMLGHKDIVCIPHLGASTPESEDNCAVMAADELQDYLVNGNIANSVNFPNVSMAREFPHRLCVAHKNVPNILNTLTSACGVNGINIENMQNKSKKDYAYTLLDSATPFDSDAVAKLEGIEGILRIRVL